MPYKNKEAKRAADRAYRARKAIAAGREPGKTGRPKLIGPPKPKHLNRGDRTEEYKKSWAKTSEVNAKEREALEYALNWPYTQNHTIARAVEIATEFVRPDNRDKVQDGKWEDMVCEVTLALVEDRDPYEAARTFKKYLNDYQYHCATGSRKSIFDEIDAIPVKVENEGSGVYNVNYKD